MPRQPLEWIRRTLNQDKGRGKDRRTDSGSHKQSTEERLVLGGFIILLVVGGLLMLLIMGRGPAAVGVGVLLLGTGLLLALYKGLELLEHWLRRE